MEIIIYLLAVWGLSFIIKETDGPWDIIFTIRSKLIANKYVGVFFAKLFDCYACTGFHVGWIIYLITAQSYKWQNFLLYPLAGAAGSLILDALFSYLHRQSI